MRKARLPYALANGQGYSWPQTWRPVGPPGAMVKNDEPVPTTWKAPISPAITAAAFRLFGSYSTRAAVVLELFQVLLSLISVYVIFRLGKALFNEWTGVVAALIFALYPASIYFSVKKIEYGTLLTLLGLLLIQQTLALAKRPTMSGSLLLGAIAGVATLVNPVILAFFPPAVLWFLWTCKSDWRTRLKSATAIGVCCAAVLAPWLIRNYLVFDQFMFVRSNFSREFVIANSPKDGRARAAETSDEGQTSSLFNQKALGLVLAKPVDFLRNVAIRFKNFWTSVNGPGGRARFAVGAAYYSVLFFGLAGLWAARRHVQVQLLMLYLGTMPIPFYLTWARMNRFRFPIEPVLILFASYALTSLIVAAARSRPGHSEAA